jgi:hypothetical protein
MITHLHPIYTESCGDPTGMLATNHKNVDCPACLAKIVKPVDLNNCELTPFFLAVVAEFNRGLAKYGEWHMMTAQEQIAAVKSECLEWEAASLKTVGGREREMQELTHLANVCGKRWKELKRSEL